MGKISFWNNTHSPFTILAPEEQGPEMLLGQCTASFASSESSESFFSVSATGLFWDRKQITLGFCVCFPST